jgi:hypothetical protein
MLRPGGAAFVHAHVGWLFRRDGSGRAGAARAATCRTLAYGRPWKAARMLRPVGLARIHGSSVDPDLAARLSGSRRVMSGDDCEQVADALAAGERVGDGALGLDRVVVAAAHAPPGDVAGVRELADDAVRGALGDPDRFADVAQAGAGVLGEAQQHGGVVGEKGPGGCPVPRHDTRLQFLDSCVSYSRA